MRAQNTTILPPELARKVSPLLVNSAEVAGAVGKSALTGVGESVIARSSRTRTSGRAATGIGKTHLTDQIDDFS
jgi:hypothetical protein